MTVGDHRDGEPCPLELTAGELADASGGEVADARPLERLLNGEWCTVGAGDQGDGLCDREVGKQRPALQHGVDAPIDDRRPRVTGEQPGRAGGGVGEAEGEIDGGGLSRAVRPE